MEGLGFTGLQCLNFDDRMKLRLSYTLDWHSYSRCFATVKLSSEGITESWGGIGALTKYKTLLVPSSDFWLITFRKSTVEYGTSCSGIYIG